MTFLGFVSSRMTVDTCIAGDAYPVDAPDLNPLCGSSCDSTSLSTDFVKMPIGKWIHRIILSIEINTNIYLIILVEYRCPKGNFTKSV